MNDLFVSIVGFTICSCAIIFSGIKLAKYGDAIAELTGMGKAWIGLILMASVTSLPELFTGISSVAFVNEPDLAAGDVFGSCIFNLLILSFVDARIKKPLTSLVKSNHIFTGLLGIILIAISGYAIL
jgi:cation:H+ antiporter